MAASSPKLGTFLACALLLAGGCAKGSCDTRASGQVWAPSCNLEGEPFDLRPDFCAMQPSASVEIIDLVVQRGSDVKTYSDGISVFIREPEALKESLLGTEIELGGLEAPIEMTFYLNETCPGVARVITYGAVSGTIRFDELFVPWVDNATQETRATFTNVEFVDQQDADERRAVLDGDFSFFFERGRPVQFFGN